MPKAFNRGWSSEQDSQLQKLVSSSSPSGRTRWVWLAQQLSAACGRERTGKQCRERWQHQLNPQISREGWSETETLKLFDLQRRFGNRWSLIAQHLPGRTDNITKNFFYAFVRKNITKINSSMRGGRQNGLLPQMRPFDSEFTSKLILVSDGNFQNKIRLNSHDLQAFAREILYGIITLDEGTVPGGDREDALWALIENMHNFRLNSKKKKQSKKAKQEQRFLREDQSNLSTHSHHTDHSNSKEVSDEEAELHLPQEDGGVEKGTYAQLHIPLQEKKLQGFFCSGKNNSLEDLPIATSDPSRPDLSSVGLGHPVAEERPAEMQLDLSVHMPSQRSYTRLLDSLKEHLASFSCVFTPACEEEWEFGDESPLHLPYCLPLPPNEREYSFGELFASADLLPEASFAEMPDSSLPL